MQTELKNIKPIPLGYGVFRAGTQDARMLNCERVR